MFRNIMVLAFGVFVAGYGLWSFAFSTESVWNAAFDLVAGVVMILVSILWLTRYR